MLDRAIAITNADRALLMEVDQTSTLRNRLAHRRGSEYLAGLGYLYAVAGRRAEALTTLAELQRLAQQQYVPPYHYAWIYTGLGDKDKAIALLQQVYAEHTQHVVDFKTVPMFDSLRSDERFQELVQKVGLPD